MFGKKKSCNKQTKRTRNWIFNALMTLLGKKPYEEIKIANITDEAGVARQSFYRNFTSKDDIIRKFIEGIVDEYVEKVQLKYKKDGFDAYELYLIYFKTFYEHRENLIKLRNASLIQIFYYAIGSYAKHTEKYIDPKLNSDTVKFLLGGIATMTVAWIEKGMTEPPEDISMRVTNLTQRFDDNFSLLKLITQIDYEEKEETPSEEDAGKAENDHE